MHTYGVDFLRYKFGVCHGKIVLADEDLVLSGSSNMDYRSFFLNFETDLYIRSKTLGLEIENFLTLMSEKSQKLTSDDVSAKPLVRLLVRRLMRLLSPLM